MVFISTVYTPFALKTQPLSAISNEYKVLRYLMYKTDYTFSFNKHYSKLDMYMNMGSVVEVFLQKVCFRCILWFIASVEVGNMV